MISPEQVTDLRRGIWDINYELAEKMEAELRHDVMAHIHALEDNCPQAKGIVHLGATSCFVTDNTDLLQMKKSLEIVKQRILQVLFELRDFSLKYADVVVLGATHLQAAQPTTFW